MSNARLRSKKNALNLYYVFNAKKKCILCIKLNYITANPIYQKKKIFRLRPSASLQFASRKDEYVLSIKKKKETKQNKNEYILSVGVGATMNTLL